MKRYAFAFALLAGPAFAATDPCHDLWFTRNLVFDRAGYCFTSPLGRSVFDNEGCTTSSPRLSADDREIVAQVRETEEWIGCRVDTDTSELVLDAIEWRRRLDTLPVLSRGESACLGWRNAEVPLYSGTGEGARRIGQISPGDTVSYNHELRAPFSFVTVHRGVELVAIGWTDMQADEASCTMFAG